MDRTRLEQALISVWYDSAPPPFGLKLVSILFRGVVNLRRGAYRRGLLSQRRVGVPVVVIGNISVGGSGKTPLAIWLVNALGDRDIRAGIVTRGYGGRAQSWPRVINANSSAEEVGDEAVLLARRTNAPVVAGPNRAAAAATLLDHYPVDLIVADDGLQHYGLARDFEIAVVDGERRLGNGQLLPAGPLREPMARLDQVDCVLVKGDAARANFPGALSMQLVLSEGCSLADGERVPLSSFQYTAVHAAAGIGNPDQFFSALRACGIDVAAHPFPDHASITLADLEFGDQRPVLITEKDAVKLPPTDNRRLWVVPARPVVAESEADDLLARISGLIRVS